MKSFSQKASSEFVAGEHPTCHIAISGGLAAA
jgi:hypothetical protein